MTALRPIQAPSHSPVLSLPPLLLPLCLGAHLFRFLGCPTGSDLSRLLLQSSPPSYFLVLVLCSLLIGMSHSPLPSFFLCSHWIGSSPCLIFAKLRTFAEAILMSWFSCTSSSFVAAFCSGRPDLSTVYVGRSTDLSARSATWPLHSAL